MALSSAFRISQSAIRNISAVLLACAGLGGYLLWLSSGVLVKDGNWVAVDFHVYYAAAHALAQGQNIYTAGISPPYVYPPLLAILVLPLSALPVTAATITWKVLQHLCLIAAGALLVNLVPRGARPLATGILMFGLLLAPVQNEILVGESNSLVLLLVAGAIWLTVRGTERETWDRATPASSAAAHDSPREMADHNADTLPAVAGMLLAVAASIKVLPLLLIAYFWWRGPRRVAAMATAGFVALQLASLPATSSTLRYWLVEFPSLFGQPFPFLDNQSLNAAITRAVLPTDPSLPNMQILTAPALWPLLTWLANLLALGALVLVLRPGPAPATSNGKEAYRATLLLEAGLVLLTIHLVSGSTWLHHLVDLAVPICGLVGAWWLRKVDKQSSAAVKSRASTASTFVILGITSFLLLRRPVDWLPLFSAVASNPPIALVISSSALWAVILLWMAVALSLRKVWLPYQSSRRTALAAK